MARETVPVPIFQKVYRSVDGVELSDENLLLIDGYTSELGGTVARPGTSAKWTVSSATGIGFDGLLYWQDQDQVIGVSNGEVFRFTYVSKEAVASSASTSKFLNTGQRASFATDGTNLLIANGSQVGLMTSTTAFVPITGTNIPSSVSHVEYLDGYFLCNDVGTNKFYWSDVNVPLSWGALNFASASGSSDPIVAIKVLNREIYLFGERSIEIWENDGSTPFIRTAGGFIQSGCSAPHSIVVDNNEIFWLDENRHLVKFNGRGVERLSSTYDREIQSFPIVSDCYAYRIEIESRPFFIFSFPTANRTLVYNYIKDEWCEWGKYDAFCADYDRWIGGAYCYAEPWGLHILGRRDKQVLSCLSSDFHTDDGDIIRVVRRTGNLSYGSLKNKVSHEFRMIAKRGEGTTPSSKTPKAMIRYKVDNRQWSQLKEFSLGKLGEYELVLRDKRRNIFRTKQYEFSATDAVAIVFTKAEEDLEVLR